MKSFTANWEDEENNRLVELLVDYRLADGQPTVDRVTPKTVTFLCSETKQPTRKIRIWTEGGRQLLARRYQERVDANRLLQQLEVAELESAV